MTKKGTTNNKIAFNEKNINNLWTTNFQGLIL
jgi:hypothetical protein